MKITIDQIAWYTVVTLRRSCLDSHLSSLRKHYPQLTVYVVDNNAEQYNIDDIAEKYNAKLLKNGKELLSLTENQQRWSEQLFKDYQALCFSSDDIQILEGGFIELALERLNQGKDITSFSTDGDPVAYMYNQRFFRELGFNQQLRGKEDTDTDLIKRTRAHYGSLDYVGEYWVNDDNSWRSRYVLNPRLGLYGKTDVNEDLESLGLDSGRLTNRSRI
jgi:hypothetical protein